LKKGFRPVCRLRENDRVDLRSHMGRGVYTAASKNTVISNKEQMSLHDGLLGGMFPETKRNEVLQNPNLDPVRFPVGPATRFERERLYIAREAQDREDMRVTRAVERQLALVASGQARATAAGWF
jgi:hypothetical protein